MRGGVLQALRDVWGRCDAWHGLRRRLLRGPRLPPHLCLFARLAASACALVTAILLARRRSRLHVRALLGPPLRSCHSHPQTRRRGWEVVGISTSGLAASLPAPSLASMRRATSSPPRRPTPPPKRGRRRQACTRADVTTPLRQGRGQGRGRCRHDGCHVLLYLPQVVECGSRVQVSWGCLHRIT